MSSLTSLIPVPRSRTLGGVSVLVSEATLADVAELQGILDDSHPDPLASISEIMSDPDEGRRHASLVAAYDSADSGPPRYGEMDAVEFFRRPENMILRLNVILRKHQRFPVEKVVELAVNSTHEERDSILRVFHATDPVDVLETLLLGEDDGPSGRRINWASAIDELSRHRGWPYEVIYRMTLTEYFNARREGRPKDRGRQLTPGEDPVAAHERHMTRMYGPNWRTRRV